MAAGNFSNNGVDTFDATKRYYGIRLQQGVPLLDRDWNELEDIRRYAEFSLRGNYIGDGAPDTTSFAIQPPPFAADNDILIGAGRCSVGGYDVWNEQDLLFSEQGAQQPLPAAEASDDVLLIWLSPQITRVTSADDPALANAQDINVETCVRDRLEWTVGATREPDVPPAGAFVLAEIHRPAGTIQISAAMIVDRRRTQLSLARTVDRIAQDEQRLTALEAGLQQAQLDIALMKQELGRLFWDVHVEVDRTLALFGAAARVTITVKDRDGTAIQGANLSLSTDWGSVDPVFAATDANGQASAELVGVYTDWHPPAAHVGLLASVAQRVDLARVSSGAAVQYAQLRFEPAEMSLISRYSPPAWTVDLAPDIPTTPIVALPQPRTATLTVHAKEGDGAIVRGVGSAQIAFGLWVRDWALTKVLNITSDVAVGARIGDVMRQGVVGGAFQHDQVIAQLPGTLQAINDDTHDSLKRAIFQDPTITDDDVHGAGSISQVIAQEATAAVGARTGQAVNQQLDNFVAGGVVDAASAGDGRTRVTQAAAAIHAGFAQTARQLYTTQRLGV
jgi:hypothetical protein